MKVDVLNLLSFESGIFSKGVELFRGRDIDGRAIYLAGRGDWVDAVCGAHRINKFNFEVFYLGPNIFKVRYYNYC